MAKPERITFSPEQLKAIEEDAAIGSTQDDICLLLGISKTTLNRRIVDTEEFKLAYRRGKMRFRQSIRRRQSEIMLSDGPGASTLSIWLGKNVLGQRDKFDVEVDERRSVKDLSRDELLAIAAKEAEKPEPAE